MEGINNYEDYNKFGDFETISEENFWDWNIAKHHEAQLNFMQTLFPEEPWEDKSLWDCRVHQGTSNGRPWTQMCICNRYYYGTNNIFSVFWRIDTDSDGPYLSLRLYEGYDKNDMCQKSFHLKTYDVMSTVVKYFIESGSIFDWKDVYPEFRGNYKESSLLHIKLKNVIQNWKIEENSFVKEIKYITKKFSTEIQTI